MVLIEFIPNMIANVIAIVVYFYANIVGLLHCKNQTVWKKTVHKVTAMDESATVNTSNAISESPAEEVIAEEKEKQTV